MRAQERAGAAPTSPCPRHSPESAQAPPRALLLPPLLGAPPRGCWPGPLEFKYPLLLPCLPLNPPPADPYVVPYGRPCLLGHCGSVHSFSSLLLKPLGLALGMPEWSWLLSSRTQSGMGPRLVKHVVCSCNECFDRYLYWIWEILKEMSE